MILKYQLTQYAMKSRSRNRIIVSSITNNSVSNTLDLSSDCGFLRRESTYSQISSAITDNVDKDLKEKLLALKRRLEISVLGRGSYGIRAMSLYSDIDLLVFGKNSNLYEIERLIQKTLIERRVSLKLVDRDYFNDKKPSLAMLFNYNSMRYVLGNKGVAVDFQQFLRASILMHDITALETLRETDVNRGSSDKDHNTPHYYSIKRGSGCLIDLEYCKLLITYAKEKGVFVPSSLVSMIEEMHRYLIALKHFLHVRYRSPMESCEDLYFYQNANTLCVPSCFHKSKLEQVRDKVIGAIESITSLIRNTEMPE